MRALDLGQHRVPVVLHRDVEGVIDAGPWRARSVAIATPPSRFTAAATALPMAPAAPVISTILSSRRATLVPDSENLWEGCTPRPFASLEHRTAPARKGRSQS